MVMLIVLNLAFPFIFWRQICMSTPHRELNNTKIKAEVHCESPNVQIHLSHSQLGGKLPPHPRAVQKKISHHITVTK